MNWLSKFKNERGSATIEFLGIVPLALLLLVIIIQFVVIINAALITQSAANEAASVFSVTKNEGKAQEAANKIINSSGNYLTGSATISRTGSKEFEAAVSVNIKLIFLPDRIGSYAFPLIPHNATTTGRVIE